MQGVSVYHGDDFKTFSQKHKLKTMRKLFNFCQVTLIKSVERHTTNQP